MVQTTARIDIPAVINSKFVFTTSCSLKCPKVFTLYPRIGSAKNTKETALKTATQEEAIQLQQVVISEEPRNNTEQPDQTPAPAVMNPPALPLTSSDVISPTTMLTTKAVNATPNPGPEEPMQPNGGVFWRPKPSSTAQGLCAADWARKEENCRKVGKDFADYWKHVVCANPALKAEWEKKSKESFTRVGSLIFTLVARNA
ncbi:hypothetical protein PM082_006282 [Marasmius tenuissimus]|nr:hypothetical protein PM082_006282 [Marasmius tenuissimus]